MLKKKIYAVAHPETGEMLTLDKNEETMTLRVDQETPEFGGNSGTFFNDGKRTLFLRGPKDKMKKFFGHLKDGQDMSEWIQHIAYRESNQPFFEGQNPLVNPTTGSEISANGQNVYREYFAAPEGTPDQRLVRDVIESENDSKIANQIIAAARGGE